ncbi:MAG TPA: cache domain-containing protein, partial [Rariglobus sp.]
MHLSLRNRILLPALAITITITGALSVVSFLMSRNAIEENITSNLRQICDSGLQQVENWVEGQRINVSHWAAKPHVLAALQTTPEAGLARGTLNTELANAYASYGFFDNILLVDLKGDTLSGNQPDSIGKLNVADRDYFKEVVATGEPVISRVLKNKVTGHPVVVLAAPVKDGRTVRGVLIASLNLDWFSVHLIEKIKVLQTGYAFLYDEQGGFIAHPNKSMIMTAKLSDFGWDTLLMQRDSGEVTYFFKGVKKIAWFKNSQTLHWGLAVGVPVSEMLATTYRMGAINLTMGLGAVVVGATLMFLVARSISRPLQQMADHLGTCSAETISAAGQVSDASQSLAQGSSEQASSLEETSASLEEMSSMTKRNSESAARANELARAARHAADTGSTDMRSMSDSMADIKTSSDDIAKIIKTIDEIAFQTNI